MLRLILLFILVFTLHLEARVMYGTYLTHTDGDTVVFQSGDKLLLCQLDGIDAPELYTTKKMIRDAKRAQIRYDDLQQRGMDAYVYLRNSLMRDVEYKIDVRRGNYKQVQRCLVYLPGQSRSLNERAVLDGYALLDESSSMFKNIRLRARFSHLQEGAMVDRSGLWRDHFNTMYRLSR